LFFKKAPNGAGFFVEIAAMNEWSNQKTLAVFLAACAVIIITIGAWS
jgi:hypothetical protein